MNNDGNADNVTTDDSKFSEYKSSLLKGLDSRNTAANANPNCWCP